MIFKLEPEDESFLKLAAKVASGKANTEEKGALQSLFITTPQLRQDFTQLQRSVKNEGRRRFWDLALRKIVGTASVEEAEEIEALALENPKWTHEYQDAVEFLKTMMSRSASMKTAKPEPMPPDVQSKILESVASKNRQRSL